MTLSEGEGNGQPKSSAPPPSIPAKRSLFDGRRAVYFFSGALILFAVIGVFLLFRAAELPARPSTPIHAAQNDADYEKTLLQQDMEGLRAEATKMRQFEKTVNYAGRETRIVKHFLDLLAPGGCRDISAIEFWSTRTSETLFARAKCADAAENDEVLSFAWTVEGAFVTRPGRPGTANFPP
jgi:hypothetical protein